QGDDFGFKTSTLVPPKILENYVLPWHKKIAELAHKNGLIYVFHSCGYLEPVMESLIEDVKIDVKHSFEDAIMPVSEFKEKYGKRIGVMGGIDVDKICRLEETELRKYVRNTLDRCMPGGGYVLGSGNSVTNYMSMSNYFAVLDEGMRWK
ncbi:MAG: uroporphyrinogen-III decarboxylase-like protein, partial [Actinobacteria bacterium]|nr:uroporphyrinogen-III decarboxylase-like protein [Actinomycetota bacterium]